MVSIYKYCTGIFVFIFYRGMYSVLHFLIVLIIAHSGREGVWGCDLSVQQSDGLGEETVTQSAGLSPGGPVSSARGQEGEQAVVGV